jgi:hypothetical protein
MRDQFGVCVRCFPKQNGRYIAVTVFIPLHSSVRWPKFSICSLFNRAHIMWLQSTLLGARVLGHILDEKPVMDHDDLHGATGYALLPELVWNVRIAVGRRTRQAIQADYDDYHQ